MVVRPRVYALTAIATAWVAGVSCGDGSPSKEPRPLASERVLLAQLDRGLRCAQREIGRVPQRLAPALPYMSEASLELLRTGRWEVQIDPTGSGRGYALRLWSALREEAIITARTAEGAWFDPDGVLSEPALGVCGRRTPRDSAELARLNVEATESDVAAAPGRVSAASGVRADDEQEGVPKACTDAGRVGATEPRATEHRWEIGSSSVSFLLENSTVDRSVVRGNRSWSWKLAIAVVGRPKVRVTVVGSEGRFDARGREGSPRSIVLRDCPQWRSDMTAYPGAIHFERRPPKRMTFRLRAGNSKRVVTVPLPERFQKEA